MTATFRLPAWAWKIKVSIGLTAFPMERSTGRCVENES